MFVLPLCFRICESNFNWLIIHPIKTQQRVFIMKTSLFLSLLVSLSSARAFVGPSPPLYFKPTTRVIPPHPVKGDSSFIDTHRDGPFDGPHTDLINATAIEWWYFDASSMEGDQAVAVWWMTSNPAAIGLNFTSSNWFIFHSRFKDGTSFDTFIPAEDVIIKTNGDGSSGLYTGTGSGWSGTPDMSHYSLSFDIQDEGIKGEVQITRTVPSRSAKRPATDLDENMRNIGALGWALAIPGGDASAYVQVGEKTISFDEGSGYHDHNWGIGLADFHNWYAIHGRFGLYTFTAIEALLISSSSSGPTTFGQTWLAYNGTTLTETLSPTAVRIRPWGNGAEYPPKGYYPNPLGAVIEIDAGEHGVFELNFTSKTSSPRIPMGQGLGKWFGTVTGGVKGKGGMVEALESGPGMFEWLDLDLGPGGSGEGLVVQGGEL